MRVIQCQFSEVLSSAPPESTALVLRSIALSYYLANLDYLRRHPRTPRLFDSGVRYEAQPPQISVWKDIPAALADPTWCDCKVLAPWLAAEMTLAGVLTYPRVSYWFNDIGVPQFHVDDKILSTGAVIDPARTLGMEL